MTLDVPVPDTVHFSSREVQTALGHFFAENPYAFV
jgi:hypothetical protein